METKIKYIKPECDVIEMEASCLMAGSGEEKVNLPTNGGNYEGGGRLPTRSKSVWDDEE